MFVGTLVAVLASALFAWIVQRGYPFVLASAEARASLEVTAEQLAELKSARLQSDCLAFGLLGALLAFTVASPQCLSVSLSKSTPIWRCLVSGAGLLGVGLLSGGLGAAAATWFEESVAGFQDPTMRFILRSALWMLPPAAFVAVAQIWLLGTSSKTADMILGAVVGVGLAILATVILHGTLTTFEARPPLMPDILENRALTGGAFVVGAGAIIIWFAHRPQPTAANENPASGKAI